MESLTPTSHAEAVAVFRHGIIGSLTQAQSEPGQLVVELEALSKKHFRPPNSATTKRFSKATLERWYYAFGRANYWASRVSKWSDRTPRPFEVKKSVGVMRAPQLLMGRRRAVPASKLPTE